MITFDGMILSLNRLGGVSVYLRELMREAALAALDFEVLVHDAALGATELNCRPNQVIYRRPRRLERFRPIRDLASGILHSIYYRSARQAGVRNVVTVHDFTYERFVSGPRAYLHSWQKRNAVLSADAVVCVSHNTRRDLLEYIPEYPADKVFVTHLAAAPHFRPVGDVKIALTDLPFVLFVGGRSAYKNFAAALDAMRLTPDLALVCVGGGPFTPHERARLDGALAGRYFHAGAVGATQLNELYNAAVCLLYPSLYEGFGIPPLEAMQAGCPFVAMNRASVPEVAGDAGILLEASDPALLAEAIRRCASPATRATLRERGFAQARKFSWRKTLEATLPVYGRVLENSKA